MMFERHRIACLDGPRCFVLYSPVRVSVWTCCLDFALGFCFFFFPFAKATVGEYPYMETLSSHENCPKVEWEHI